jgi:hypothetical protein
MRVAVLRFSGARASAKQIKQENKHLSRKNVTFPYLDVLILSRENDSV